MNLNSAYMQELQVKTDENYNDQYLDGVIFSEACTRAGSAEQLLQDVKTGQVKKSANHDGVPLYHFPRRRPIRTHRLEDDGEEVWVAVNEQRLIKWEW